MNTRQYQYVLELAKQLNFSRAAAELGVSQPSLSQYIKKIEEEIGAELFTRSGSKLFLTDAGRAYTEHARKVLTLEREMISVIADIKNEKTGSVKIGASPYCCKNLLPAAIARFKKNNPHVTVTIDELPQAALTASAKEGDCDIYIATYALNNEDMYYSDVLFKERVVVAVPADFEINERLGGKNSDGTLPTVSIREFEGLDFISMSDAQFMGATLSDIIEENNVTINNVVNCFTYDTMISLVEHGVGIAFVPDTLTRRNKDGSICYYSLSEPLPRRQINAYSPKHRYVSGFCREIIEILKNQ